MAADGEGARRARDNDDCEWFFNAPYKFRRMNWTYAEPGALLIAPAAAPAEQPQQDPQDDAAMQPEHLGQDAQLNLDDQHENEAMEVDTGN